MLQMPTNVSEIARAIGCDCGGEHRIAFGNFHHIVPDNDSVDHFRGRCSCKPSYEMYPETNSVVIVHKRVSVDA